MEEVFAFNEQARRMRRRFAYFTDLNCFGRSHYAIPILNSLYIPNSGKRQSCLNLLGRMREIKKYRLR